jgi:hypothetical protein
MRLALSRDRRVSPKPSSSARWRRDEVADLDFEFAAIIAEFFDGNVAFGLQAGVDDHEVLVDAHDFGGDDFTLAHFLARKAFFEEIGKAFLQRWDWLRHRGKNRCNRKCAG